MGDIPQQGAIFAEGPRPADIGAAHGEPLLGAGGPPAGAMRGPGGPPPGATGSPPGFDSLTGALNTSAFAQKLMTEVIPKKSNNTALWYIDIRNFRSLNPKIGFLKGNEVLKATYNGIRKHVSHDLPVSRLGADRFIFISIEMNLDDARERFDDLVQEVSDACKSFGANVQLSIMGGIYFLREFDYEKRDFNRVLDYASIAHRNARREKQSALVPFTDKDLEHDVRRIAIEQSIDAALANGQIEVWYQPQIDYIYGEVVGAEALARWNHPELGWISPEEFIPVLENCGKVHDLDLFVWEEACRNAGRWRVASDGKPVPISVNVSRAEMYEEGLMEHFLELQKKHNLPNGSLHLEVTESAFVEEAERLYEVIESMRAHEMLIEMDDFGSGLSSLNMLKDVPVDVVKLDMGFMRSAVNEDRGGVVLSSVIRMLQGLDTPIIAEGVETLEQAEMLKNMGCHLMQGFHFSRPMPLAEFESYLEANSAVESSRQRERRGSLLDELMSFDSASSYMFNYAIGPTIFFFATDGSSESILVNDQFYEVCGLERGTFGDSKINPIMEVDPESRATLWRATAEAHDTGAALCKAKVRLTGRWFEGIIRYIGTTARGDVYSLSIFKWGALEGEGANVDVQATQDAIWAYSLLDRIVPSGFVKCAIDDNLTIDFASPRLILNSGLAQDEFMRRFHNSFAEFVLPADRQNLIEAVRAAENTGELVESEIGTHYGFSGEREARFYGRVDRDSDDVAWLYGFVILKDMSESAPGIRYENEQRERAIPFDYYVADDLLIVHGILPGGETKTVEIRDWLKRLDKLPDNIAPASAAKVLATVRDLRFHPISGFTDVKCNLLGGDVLRWFHVNYTCEANENGETTIVHGYAQDANDQMGSAKWWRRQAEIDQLTGLLNRNAVEQDINLSMRMQGLGMMFMIDLDEFKRVNDEMGHIIGDGLLREVSDTLAKHFREGDVLGRYGGDEFVAFVSVSSGDLHQIAERRAADIIKEISAIEIPDGTHAGCSVGVAISRNREATFYDLLEAADKAMYKSKLAGKGSFTVVEME